jgi:hypothetical protein
LYSVTLWGDKGTPTTDTGFIIGYNTDGTSTYTDWPDVTSTSCQNQGTLTNILSGTTVYFACTASGGNYPSPNPNAPGTYIEFRAANDTTCPTAGTLYCQDPLSISATAYSVVVTSDITVSFKPTLDGSNNWNPC